MELEFDEFDEARSAWAFYKSSQLNLAQNLSGLLAMMAGNEGIRGAMAEPVDRELTVLVDLIAMARAWIAGSIPDEQIFDDLLALMSESEHG